VPICRGATHWTRSHPDTAFVADEQQTHVAAHEPAQQVPPDGPARQGRRVHLASAVIGPSFTSRAQEPRDGCGSDSPVRQLKVLRFHFSTVQSCCREPQPLGIWLGLMLGGTRGGRPASFTANPTGIVVPVFKVAEGLVVVYSKLRQTMASQDRPWESLMVDDHSGDRMPEVKTCPAHRIARRDVASNS
jgi:hypothetical protein